MCYFHLRDLVDYKTPMLSKKVYENYFKESGTYKNRLIRYLKSNIGRSRSFSSLSSVLKDFKFISIKEATLSESNFPIITL